ncbi:hypothetical protein NUW54_g14327 [Trametes sanguinea]|uniref:Uncharacterized protein n=1 Tax=Trametes sanguinea TaxID=158606 RepID=A0ACC1MDZ2_9APHY|nr:hypothetical protein NUW54_g14327 [Trametes sanguinea]
MFRVISCLHARTAQPSNLALTPRPRARYQRDSRCAALQRAVKPTPTEAVARPCQEPLGVMIILLAPPSGRPRRSSFGHGLVLGLLLGVVQPLETSLDASVSSSPRTSRTPWSTMAGDGVRGRRTVPKGEKDSPHGRTDTPSKESAKTSSNRDDTRWYDALALAAASRYMNADNAAITSPYNLSRPRHGQLACSHGSIGAKK